MKFRSYRYYIKESITNIFRNGVMSLVSILTVLCCIFMLLLTFGIAVNVDYMLQQLSSTLGFTVIIDENATVDEIDALYFEIQNVEHVAEINYIPADEGLEGFADSLGADGEILEGLKNSNPLPNIFEVSVDDPRYMDAVVKNVTALAGESIEGLRQQEDIVDGLISFNRAVRIISLIVVGLFVVISVIIIINTIKLTVNNRKTEISIMKYVGATDWFIRWPFIIEGILIGVIGAVIADVIFSYSYASLLNSSESVLDILGDFAVFKPAIEMLPLVSAIAIPMGIAIGMVASILSVRKYLKV